MSEAHRKIRHDDFKRRVSDDPEGVYRHATGGWRYIPINAFADEGEILARLGLEPDSCQACDAWWEIADDQAFISVRTKVASELSPGLYARNRGHAAEFVDLLAVVEAETITRATFEAALEAFAALDFPRAACFKIDQSRAYLPVDY